MQSLKRFIRPGLTASVVGHLAFLALGLHLVSANKSEAIQPEAMVVDIVPPEEAPRFSGTPSELRSNGSQAEVKSDTASPVAQSPPPKPPPPSQQQQQKLAKQKPDATPAAAQTKMKLAMAPQAEATDAETKKPDEAPPPAPAQQSSDDTQEPGVAESLAQMALVGGQLGGGFMAPPVNTPQAGYDITLAFRERVSACSKLPEGIGPTERVSLGLRVFLNRDGTLAQLPQPAKPFLSAKEHALFDAAVTALEECEPYTMLPPEKYKLWKTLDLVIFPANFGGG